jgi:hypothetical protein
MYKLFIKNLQNLAFLVLLLAYFFIGFYHIQNIYITYDEISHIGAAQAYSQKKEMNIEHPILLKGFNSILFSTIYSNFKSDNDSQWFRGREILENQIYSPLKILANSRYIYLAFNSLLLLWLWLYSSVFRWIDFRLAFIMGVLYVFSPSFASHLIFVTFDVAGAISLFFVAASLVLTILNWSDFNTKKSGLHIFIFFLSIFLALGTKYSNLILLPVLLSAYFLALFYFYYTNKFQSLKKMLTLGFVSPSVFLGIYFLYWYFFFSKKKLLYEAISNKTISEYLLSPVFKYFEGAKIVSSRSSNLHLNFVEDHYQKLYFLQFINRVFWFKENPALFLVMLLSLIALFYFLIKAITKLKTYLKVQKFNFQNLFQKRSNLILATISLISFPIIYTLLSAKSTLTIGYRHFFPTLIFIYFGLAFGLYKFWQISPKFNKFIVALVMVFYIIFGLAGLNQNLGYVNFLWRTDKWRLANDSTIYWTQYQIETLAYLKRENKLRGTVNNQLIGFNTSDPALAASEIMVLDITDKKEEAETFVKWVDLRKVAIEDLDYQYIVVDIKGIQNLVDEEKSSQTAKENLAFIFDKKNQVFSRDEVIFLVKVK